MQQPGDCFHLAFPMYDLEAGKDFYVQQLGFKLGRENKHAFIMNFYGHQVIAHRVSELPVPQEGIYPRHFGLNFSKYEDWLALVEKIKRNNITFFREPGKRFAGQFIEHDSFFLLDPSNNLLEFKHYKHYDAIFEAQEYAMVGES